MPSPDYKPKPPHFLDSLNYLSFGLESRLAMAEAHIREQDARVADLERDLAHSDDVWASCRDIYEADLKRLREALERISRVYPNYEWAGVLYAGSIARKALNP